MDDWFASGDCARAPMARVLAEIWKQGLSGSLYARTGGVPKCLSFERGFLTLDSVSFEEKDFLRFLLTAGEADLIALTRVEEQAQRTGGSALRALVEIPVFTAERLWELLEGYAREEALAVVADAAAEREFHTRSGPPARVYVEAVDVPSLLLEAVRRTADPAALEAVLPAGGEALRRLPAFSSDAFALTPVERYVLGLLDPPRTADEACAESDAGAAATRRALAALVLLGLAGPAGPKPKTARLPGDLTLAAMDRILGQFNAKCAFVLKYVTKEIGPVAFSLIGKAVDEVRGRLDPALRSADLQPDGRFELKTPLRVNANIVGDDCRVSMLRSMDEVLAAEVLLVKRTLGQEHESALLRSLERLGEAP